MTVKQLKEEIQIKDQFIALLVHDLRNPIGLLKNFSELLLDDIEDTSQKEIIEKLSFINDISNNTFNLLENLILWLKAQNGTISFEGVNSELKTIFKDSIASVKNLAEIKKISIQHDSDIDLEVFTDPNMLCSIIRNFLSNSIKYSHKGEKIELNYKKTSKNLIIEVKDYGIGIEQSKLNSILETEKYSDSIGGTQGEKGTGIGLNLCKTLIKELDGQMWGKSEVNKGTTMYVSIPLLTSE
jgi:signal transduction histidine kinase